MTFAEIHQLSRPEKIKLMEAIWADLSLNDSSVESPSWHLSELKKTEDRFAAGQEDVVDWSDAKKYLRKQFE